MEKLITIGDESQAYSCLFILAFAQGDQPAMQKYLEIGSKKIQESDMPTFLFNQATLAALVLAELGLAQANALVGDVAGARTAYQDFLVFWNDGDPDIPNLKQAKAEFEKLQ